MLRSLWFQVLVGTLAGIAVGHFAPAFALNLKILGDIFISLMKMIIAPVIFCSLVHGIASMHDMQRVGRIAIKTLGYFLVITLMALVIALVLVNTWRPGVGMNVDLHSIDTQSINSYVSQGREQSLSHFISGIVPDSFVGAFVQPNVIQVLVVSVVFAFALMLVPEQGRPVLSVVSALSHVFYRVVGLIMLVAPLAAFGSMAFTVSKFGAGSLVKLGELIVEFYVVSILFVVVVLGLAAWWTGVSLLRLMRHLRDEIVIVAATTSTETVLPRLMQRMQEVGCEESVVGLVIPTGYSFNLDGTCLYLATVVVFLAQATGTPLDLWHQVILLAVLLLASKGAAGVAGAAFVVLAATLSALGTIPVESIVLVFGIHRLMAEALTFVNLIGNAVATIVVSKWEGAINETQLRATIGLARTRQRVTSNAA
jgi:aerobic C4-dicarboxylate transport protein